MPCVPGVPAPRRPGLRPRLVKRPWPVSEGNPPFYYVVYLGGEEMGTVARRKVPLPWGGYAWRWFARSGQWRFAKDSVSCVADVGHFKTRAAAVRELIPRPSRRAGGRPSGSPATPGRPPRSRS
jgi:hypothetical protein